MRERIEKVLKDEVTPMLASHGGSAELVELTEDGVVKVRLSGTCAGCPGARMTLVNVVESAIRAKVPEVKSIEAV
ncbi:MAG: NifU family protein [Pseudomonadota bacterium]|jgi:Fe-S cluster biogenesis protein NfuA